MIIIRGELEKNNRNGEVVLHKIRALVLWNSEKMTGLVDGFW